jgi:imidazolonepropionase-like amidohydrolase
MRPTLLFFAFFILPLVIAAQQQQPPPPTIAILAGKLIDVDHSRILTNQIILIREDGTIAAVGANLPIPPNATTIDLTKSTVFPGLIDCHTHLADGSQQGNIDPIYQLKHSAAEMALESVPNARVFLESGFTTVRDVGVYRALTDIALRDAIAKGYIVGPRMFVAGAYITISGGAEANSPWEVRQKIRLLAAAGADHIKILSSGAVLTHGSNPQSQEFTPEELAAAVDEAKHFGLRVASHAHSPEGIKNAIRAGVASVEHASLIDDEGIALAKQHGTYLDMDIYDEECIQEEGKNGSMTADFLEHDRNLGATHRANFTKALHAGVKLSFGTDAGVCPYDRSINQFAFMVKYGMTPMQAIQSATTSAADLLGKSEILGSISVGRFADIVAAPDNPLDDIHAIEHITFVMKEGKIYKQPK